MTGSFSADLVAGVQTSRYRQSSLSLTQWIIAQRLEGARHELSLIRSERNITAICHDWGFADVTHFSRRFRSAYGISPREWRQLCREAGASGLPQ